MTRFLLLHLPFALAGCLGHLDPCSIPCRPGEPCHCVQYSEDGPGSFASFNTPDDNGGPTVDDHGPGNGGGTKDDTSDHNGGDSGSSDENGGKS